MIEFARHSRESGNPGTLPLLLRNGIGQKATSLDSRFTSRSAVEGRGNDEFDYGGNRHG